MSSIKISRHKSLIEGGRNLRALKQHQKSRNRQQNTVKCCPTKSFKKVLGCLDNQAMLADASGAIKLHLVEQVVNVIDDMVFGDSHQDVVEHAFYKLDRLRPRQARDLATGCTAFMIELLELMVWEAATDTVSVLRQVDASEFLRFPKSYVGDRGPDYRKTIASGYVGQDDSKHATGQARLAEHISSLIKNNVRSVRVFDDVETHPSLIESSE